MPHIHRSNPTRTFLPCLCFRSSPGGVSKRRVYLVVLHFEHLDATRAVHSTRRRVGRRRVRGVKSTRGRRASCCAVDLATLDSLCRSRGLQCCCAAACTCCCVASVVQGTPCCLYGAILSIQTHAKLLDALMYCFGGCVL